MIPGPRNADIQANGYSYAAPPQALAPAMAAVSLSLTNCGSHHGSREVDAGERFSEG